MKYRVINRDKDDFDVITEDGGVVVFYHNQENFVSNYYQLRLTEINPDNEIWDELSEGKLYVKDWEGVPTQEEVVNDALGWLVANEEVEWEVDDTLFSNLF